MMLFEKSSWIYGIDGYVRESKYKTSNEANSAAVRSVLLKIKWSKLFVDEKSVDISFLLYILLKAAILAASF